MPRPVYQNPDSYTALGNVKENRKRLRSVDEEFGADQQEPNHNSSRHSHAHTSSYIPIRQKFLMGGERDTVNSRREQFRYVYIN